MDPRATHVAHKGPGAVDAPTAVTTALRATTEDENQGAPTRRGVLQYAPTIYQPVMGYFQGSRRSFGADRSPHPTIPVGESYFQSSVDAPRGTPEG